MGDSANGVRESWGLGEPALKLWPGWLVTTGVAGPRGAGGTCPHCELLGWSRRGPAGPGDCGERLGEEPGELRGGCGGRSGTLGVGSRGPAESPQSPRAGQRKDRRLQEGATCRRKDLTVPEFVCAA